jgi:hypothetical protein
LLSAWVSGSERFIGEMIQGCRRPKGDRTCGIEVREAWCTFMMVTVV